MRAALVAAVLVVGCSDPAEARPRPERSAARPRDESSDRATPRTAEGPVAPLPPARLPAPPRLIAVGDVHGDVDALRAALRLGGAVGADDHWAGGALWVVQMGDLLDRGDTEDEILALLDRLEGEAGMAGGRLIVLNGNHELMNAQGDFRYVTPGGFADFANYGRGIEAPPGVPEAMLGRVVAFAPGGLLARSFASHPTAIQIGDTVFVHGGLSVASAERGLNAINEDMRRYLLEGGELPPSLSGDESPVWHRGFALEVDEAGCAELARVLSALGATRMVIGHTVQEHGITSACDERVFRIDVGLSRHYGGPTQVLALEGETATIVR